MGCNNSKNNKLNNIDIGDYIIRLIDENTIYDFKIHLDSSIKLYEYEKDKIIGGDIDYKTKCIIVMCFIRDIYKIICNNKKVFKMNDINKNDYINKYLINLKIPIFIIEELEKYRKNINTDNLIKMKLYDNEEYISSDKSINVYSIDKKLNIMCNLINNIQNI